MFVGHLLAAGEVQAHQGTETEKEGEVQHKEDVLHHRAWKQSLLVRVHPVGSEQPLWYLLPGVSPVLGGSTASPLEHSPHAWSSRISLRGPCCQLEIWGLRAAGFQGPGWHCHHHPGQLPHWVIPWGLPFHKPRAPG